MPTSAASSVRPLFAAALAFALVAAGCADDVSSRSRVRGARAPLSGITVSAPFELEDAPVVPPAWWGVQDAKLACGPSQCVVARIESMQWGSVLYVDRFAFDGTKLSTTSRPVSGQQLLAVAPLGSDFAVATSVTVVAYPSITTEYHVYRLSGVDLAVTSLDASLPSGVVGLVSDGSTLLVLHGNGSEVHATAFDAGTLAPKGPAISLPFLPTVSVPGAGQFLLATTSAFVRVSATDGALLDATKKSFNLYLPVDSIAGAYVDGAYVLGFVSPSPMETGGGNVYVVRIAPDGTVLDADDEFNQLPGARSVCVACARDGYSGSLTGVVSVAAHGGDALVLFSGRTNDSSLWRLFESRVTVATGAVRGGTYAPELDLGASSARFAAAVHGNDALVLGWLSETAVHGYAITDAPFSIAPRPITPLTGEATPRKWPAAGSNGTDFLIAFTVGEQVMVTRVDGGTGAYRDTPPIVVGTGSLRVPPAIGSVGTDYLVAWVSVAWQPYIGQVSTLHHRIVRADGSLGDEQTLDIATAYSASETTRVVQGLRVVGNATHYLVAWIDTTAGPAVYGLRVLPTGAPADASQVYYGGSNVGYFGVAADRPANPTMSTFLVGYHGTSGALLRRIRATSGSVINPETSIDDPSGPAGGQVFGGASDGAHHVFAWHQGDHDWLGAFDAVTGAHVGSPVDLGFSSGLQVRDVLFDGRSFLLALYTNGNLNQLSIRRFGTSAFADLDAVFGTQGQPIFTDLGFDPDGQPKPVALASNANGRTLIVNQEGSPERRVLRYVGRFLDDDGNPSTLPAQDGGIDSDAGFLGDASIGDDAGVVADGGIEGDAGFLGDASIGDDAGVVADGGSDGGEDAASTSDAGATADAGSTSDAGATADAGSTSDAGAASDAAVPTDASVGADAGTVVDAGVDAGSVSGQDAGLDAAVSDPSVEGDGGTSTSSSGGCSVAAPGRGGGIPSFAWLIGVGTIFARRRRRGTSS